MGKHEHPTKDKDNVGQCLAIIPGTNQKCGCHKYSSKPKANSRMYINYFLVQTILMLVIAEITIFFLYYADHFSKFSAPFAVCFILTLWYFVSYKPYRKIFEKECLE